MRRVSPEEFRDAFLTVLTAERANVDAVIAQRNNRAYTVFFRDSLLPMIAKKLGEEMQSWKEYYYLDSVFFEERDQINFGVNSVYAKFLSVAVEHENYCGKTREEIYKLQLFNTPLKVLITYAMEGAEIDKLLAQYSNIIRAADVFGDIATLRRQLVIFGTPTETAERWRFYLYEKEGFTEITQSR